jgi:DNA-binding transcriptional ArsR family regulator
MSEQHSIQAKGQGLPADLLADVAATFKALSDPNRAQLVYLLTNNEFNVNELSAQVSISASTVSHHLAKLRAIRLVRTRREGTQIFYSIDDRHVAALFQEVLYHLDHVRQNLPDHPYPLKSNQ